MRKYSDSTLLSMTKAELVDQLRCAEHNREVAEEALAQQAENIKDWEPVVHGRWREAGPLLECPFCGEIYSRLGGNSGKSWNYCPNCGARMGQN